MTFLLENETFWMGLYLHEKQSLIFNKETFILFNYRIIENLIFHHFKLSKNLQQSIYFIKNALENPSINFHGIEKHVIN